MSGRRGNFFQLHRINPDHGPLSDNAKHAMVIEAEVGLKLRAASRNILKEPGFPHSAQEFHMSTFRRGRTLKGILTPDLQLEVIKRMTPLGPSSERLLTDLPSALCNFKPITRRQAYNN